MQEAAARGNPEEIALKILALEREHLIRPDAETSAKLEKLKNELSEVLMNYERRNKDIFNLS